MSKVGDGHLHLTDLRVELVYFLMRQPEKLLEHAQLVHHLKSRWMNGIAAKIAQEITMLFQHQDLDARTRQQVRQHHACRTAATDAATHGNFLWHHIFSLPSSPRLSIAPAI